MTPEEKLELQKRIKLSDDLMEELSDVQHRLDNLKKGTGLHNLTVNCINDKIEFYYLDDPVFSVTMTGITDFIEDTLRRRVLELTQQIKDV